MTDNEKKKGVIRRHPILAGLSAGVILIIVVVIAISAMLSSAANQALKPAKVGGQQPSHSSSAPAQPGKTAPVPNGAPTLPLGTPLPVEQGGNNAAVITATKVSTTTHQTQYGEPPQNGYFVTVKVKVKILPGYTQGFDINPLDFYATVNGTHYDEANGTSLTGAPGSDSQIDATTLNAGESSSGTLVFDLPGTHGKIAYSPNLEGGPLAYWKF